jgi:hypothetical protein
VKCAEIGHIADVSRRVWIAHDQAAREEGAYWRARSIDERVAAVELIRRATPATAASATARMGRVFELIELTPRSVPDRGRARAGRSRRA